MLDETPLLLDLFPLHFSRIPLFESGIQSVTLKERLLKHLHYRLEDIAFTGLLLQINALRERLLPGIVSTTSSWFCFAPYFREPLAHQG